MAITSKIVKKIKEKAKDDPKLEEFLTAIIEKEESGGQYKKKYEELLIKAEKGDKQ